jgi:hypothetical protein
MSGFSRTYPGFTTMTARDLQPGFAIRIPGREHYVGEILEINKGDRDVAVTWADESFTVLHGNDYVQVQMG